MMYLVPHAAVAEGKNPRTRAKRERSKMRHTNYNWLLDEPKDVLNRLRTN